MALFSKKQRQTFAADALDWRMSPDIAAQQAKLQARQAQLGDLALAYQHATNELAQIERALQQAEMMRLAGRTDASAVEQLTRQRDAAKEALAVATVEHAECLRDVELLTAGLPLVTEAAKHETATQIISAYTALLADFKAKVDAAVATNEALFRLYLQAREQFPSDVYADGWPQALGLFPPPLQGLREPYTSGAVHYPTEYELYCEAYAAWLKDRKTRTAHIEPIRPAQQSDPTIETPPVATNSAITDVFHISAIPTLQEVMAQLGVKR